MSWPFSHSPGQTPSRILCGTLTFIVLVLAGCGRSEADKALDSDANGYMCIACGEKFYTEREVFASHCPKCRKPDIDQVLGFVCSADQHVTIGGRGRGARACEKCGRASAAVSIPRETELKAWGASRKSAGEVGG